MSPQQQIELIESRLVWARSEDDEIMAKREIKKITKKAQEEEE